MTFKWLKRSNIDFTFTRDSLVKPSFTLIELLLVIIVVGLISTIPLINKETYTLEQAAKQIKLHIETTQLNSLKNDSFTYDDVEYYKEWWKIKFMRCKNNSGLYYVVYSDKDRNGYIKREECALDPLTKTKLYSNNDCIATDDESKIVLLTELYNIDKVDISCNNTSSIGEIVFDYKGRAHSKISDDEKRIYKNLLDEKCTISLYSRDLKSISLEIEPQTGSVKIK